ncbi:MAG: penicillin-binding transpeptidase domain-containing protein [Pseudomonadota bacterium]
MPRLLTDLMQAIAQRRRALRRGWNLRAGGSPRAPVRTAPGGMPRTARPGWLALLAAFAVVAGALAIVGHARHLGESAIATADAAGADHAANVYQPVLPGAVFSVPAQPGVHMSVAQGGALLALPGMQGMGLVKVDLCSQLREPGGERLLPLRLGYRFDDVQRWVEQGRASAAPVLLRNVLLVGGASAATEAMPEVRIAGMARPDFADPQGEPLQLSWRSAQGKVRWLSDASFGQVEQGATGEVAFRRQGWLTWGDAAALRIERRASTACPQAGELLVQVYRPAPPDRNPAAGARALTVAFPARGAAVAAYLAPGSYIVPAAPRAALEDQALFTALQARSLLRLTAGGMIDIAPRDLPLWAATAPAGRAAELENWKNVTLDDGAVKLLKRLYQQADGAYVRQQIDIYNGERRLVAWRVQSGADWQAGTAAGPAPVASYMPPTAARLFSELPQGWQAWSRVAYWPPAGADNTVRLTLDLTGGAPRALSPLLVAGRVLAVRGAQATISAACTGRACTSPADVQQLTLHAEPGARAITVDVQALDISAMGGPGDQQYRHLRIVAGRLAWQALENANGNGAVARARPATPVQLRDRNGTLLWADGAATEAARDAGLATMLGVHPDHAGSIAGMLARLPGASGAAVDGTLALDLPLQALGQHILDCIGMRRGRWDGQACVGGQAPPPGRRAGLVVLDTETGDVLVAAGSGAGAVGSANWAEVRDFDRADPARSPLRLPALQHDGGAHHSPGSTFKIVSALGLELAAKNDAQLDALLGGMPLGAINGVARQRGFAFETGAATYPAGGQLAHITNYKDQGLDRRAQEGKLGLAQALTYSLNTWFAWSSELSDRSLFGRADGGAPDVQALEAGALDPVRPIVAAAHRLGFEQGLRLDGGLLPPDFMWSSYDALQATPAHMDATHTRHELRQMAIGLRMQVTPLQMALVSAAVGQGNIVAPRLLLALDGKTGQLAPAQPLGIRLDRIRAGMKGVVDAGTAAGAFGAPVLAQLRPGLYGKTGTAPVSDSAATVWFTGWLEPGRLPGQAHRLAMAVFVSHSEASGGEHAAPVVAALLSTLAAQKPEQKGK